MAFYPLNSSRIFRYFLLLLFGDYGIQYSMYIDDSAKEKFSTKVIERVKSTKLPFMDCVLELAEEMNIEPNAAGKLLTKPLIEKIEAEAITLH
ncbi:MAG: late promoter transcription accessory protein, partial [bacterium]